MQATSQQDATADAFYTNPALPNSGTIDTNDKPLLETTRCSVDLANTHLTRTATGYRRQGDRYEKPGKERIIGDGTLVEGRSNAVPVQLTWQLPNLVRIGVGGSGGRTMVFDGQNSQSSKGQADDVDEDIIESLVSDSVEGLLAIAAAGVPTRLLGQGFRPEPKIAPNYTGPTFDIYDVYTTPEKTRRNKTARAKRFIFQSDTANLVRVVYRGTAPLIQTVYSGWKTIQGVAIPGKIERLSNSEAVWSIQINSSTVVAAGDATPFQRPV